MADFVRHFRIYFKNNHPAYIVDEEGNKYVFHRTTHSKTSGGRKNWRKKNPINDHDPRDLYIIKKEQRDDKGRFSLFKVEIKKGVDVSYPEIKKAGSTQVQSNRAETQTSTIIKPKNKKKGKQKARRTQAIHDSNHGRATLTSSRNIKSNNTKKANKNRFDTDHRS